MPNASKIGLTEGDAPGTPGSGISRLYPKTDHLWYTKDSAGTERELYSAGGTDIPVADGGTGASTLTDHGVLVGSGTSAVTALSVGTNGQVLVGSTGADPVFATITDGEGIDTALGAGTLTIACETASDTNPGVVELATNAEALTGTDTTRAVTPDDIKYVLDRRNLNLQNLLSNTDWIVASGSTLENVGSAIQSDDCADDGTADWTLGSGSSLTFNTDHYDLVDTTNGIKLTTEGTYTVGKLYKLSIDVKDGTASGIPFYFGVSHGGTWAGATPLSKSGTTTSSFVTHTLVVKATGTSFTFQFAVSSTTGANNIQIKNITLYEVTPGYVAADGKGPDGWAKDSGVLLYREHNGTYTKDGSFYSLKAVTTADKYFYYRGPASIAPNTNADWYRQFAGRTITFGMWVYATAANAVQIGIYDGVSNLSTYHTGVAGWEWIECTLAVGTSKTEMTPLVRVNNTTAYFSQPMLVFGSYIGAGNYAPRRGEIVWLEKEIVVSSLNNKTGASGFSDASNVLLNIESETSGLIGKGIKALYFKARVNDSGSAAATLGAYLYLNGGGTIPDSFHITTAGLANDAQTLKAGWQPTNSDGNVYYTIDATGSNTFDIQEFKINAVQLQ